VGPLLLVAAGVVALVAAGVTLRSFGPRYRVARLLAATPAVTVAQARQLAEQGVADYVRINGRIDAEDSFEDADHRPLVLRRTRFVARSGRGWTPFEDSREAVPFEIHEGLDTIVVDGAALDEGLVVVARESEGLAGDIGDRAPSDLDPATPVRAIIEQVSAVDHAIVVGVPRTDGEGGAIEMTAGLGRPLILTTLETDEAMRILAQGTNRPRLVAACLVAGTALIVAGLAWAGIGAIVDAIAIVGRAIVPVALAASPSPPAVGGDPRSSGEGPGLVGEPGIAILAVAIIAIASVVVTTLWIRLTDDRRADDRQGSNARRNR
jgi:type II secretory pathway pseudopilin PulG